MPDVPPVATNLNAAIERFNATVELPAERLTNERIARELDLTERTVRRWRKGDAVPRWEDLGRLAALLGCSAYDFYARPALKAAA